MGQNARTVACVHWLFSASAWPKYPTAYGSAIASKLRDDFDNAVEGLDALVTPTLIEPARSYLGFTGCPKEWESFRCDYMDTQKNVRKN